MIPCTLAPQKLRGGDVTLWDLDVAALEHWAAAPIDPRPPSHDQLGRLHEDPDGLGEWSPFIGFSVLLPAATRESVEQTLTAWLRQHESLRSHLELVDGQPVRQTLEVDHVALSPRHLGAHDADELHALLTREYHERCRPSRRSAWALITVAGEHGHVLYAAFDHITFDGLSAYGAVGHVAGLHTAVVNGVHEQHISPSYVDVADQEVAVGVTTTADDPRLHPWRDFLADGHAPAAPPESGITPDGHYEHRLVHHDICDGDAAARLALRYSAEGFPTGMLWTAVLMQSLGDEAHALMSTHGRPSALWMDSVGWFAGVAPLSMSLPPGSSTRDWVIEGVRVWRETAPAAALPIGLVQQLLDVSVRPQIVLSLIDGSRIDGHEWWRPLHSQIHLGDVPPSSQTHMWLTIHPEGVTLATRLPLAPGAEAWLGEVAERFSRLVEAETSTPFAPSQEISA